MVCKRFRATSCVSRFEHDAPYISPAISNFLAECRWLVAWPMNWSFEEV